MVFLLILLLWVMSLCLHEYAHARVAYAGGDTSVAAKGYLSLNPARYMDPVLSILMPVIFLAMGGIPLPGGAVYIERWRLRSRGWEMAVSAAGPLSNCAIVVVIGLAFRLGYPDGSMVWTTLACFGMLQVACVVLNLLPVPPLDGYGIVAPLLDPKARAKADQAGRYGIWVLFLALWFIQPLNNIYWRVVVYLCDRVGIPVYQAFVGFQEFRSFLEFKK